MDGVTIVGHPLVQHKLTLLRKKDISTKSFRELLKEIGVLLCYEVTRDLPLDLPSAHADQTRLRQILINYIGNALKFTERGSIRVKVVREDAMWTFSVTDSGIEWCDPALVDKLDRVRREARLEARMA